MVKKQVADMEVGNVYPAITRVNEDYYIKGIAKLADKNYVWFMSDSGDDFLLSRNELLILLK